MENSKASRCSSHRGNNVWDCGSALYDSYELDSFKRQLDSAIANSPSNIITRTLSMPHLSEQRYNHHLSLVQRSPQPRVSNNNNNNTNKSFKISRTFQKLLRFVFKPSNKLRFSSNQSSNISFHVSEKYSNPKDRFYVVYDKSEPSLSTIPELPEFESPEITSFVRRSTSERFPATAAVGISCA